MAIEWYLLHKTFTFDTVSARLDDVTTSFIETNRLMHLYTKITTLECHFAISGHPIDASQTVDISCYGYLSREINNITSVRVNARLSSNL